MSTQSGMMRQVTVAKLFAENQGRLGLTWLAGGQGGSKVLTGEAALKPTVGQVGHMNFIHPFRIQILGAAEIAYLGSLSPDELRAVVDALFTIDLAVIVVANGEPVPPYLAEQIIGLELPTNAKKGQAIGGMND